MQHLALVSAVVALCVAVAHGQATVTLPPTLTTTFTSTAAQASCSSLATSFQDKWTTLSTGCATAATRTTWATYRGHLTFTTPFATLGTSTDEADCRAKAGALATADQAAGTALCNWLDKVVTDCVCQKIDCVTKEVNGGVNSTNAAACNGFGKSVCDAFKPEIATDCKAAVETTLPNNGATLGGDVPKACTADDCPAATVATTTPAPAPTTRTTSTTSAAVSVTSGISVTSGHFVAAAAAALGVSLL